MSFVPLQFTVELIDSHLVSFDVYSAREYEHVLAAFIGPDPHVMLIHENGEGAILYKCNMLKVTIQPQGVKMDKQIKKVKKSLDKGEKDTKKLLKMDKKYDRELDKCREMKGKPKKKM